MSHARPDLTEVKFPVSAGIFLGLGFGGFFDGIVFHQLLQWHHVVSGWYPINSAENLKLNIFWDGILHSGTYVLVLTGVFILWRSAYRIHRSWLNSSSVGSVLIGWGIFNVVEGVLNHTVLGLHRVNEIADPSHRLLWDIGFLVWGALMAAVGDFWWRGDRNDSLAGTDCLRSFWGCPSGHADPGYQGDVDTRRWSNSF
jgi:uncharacterized membrane protein